MAQIPTLWEQTMAPIRASRRLMNSSGSRVLVRPQLEDPQRSNHTCRCVCVGSRIRRRSSSHSCIKAVRQAPRYLVHEVGVRVTTIGLWRKAEGVCKEDYATQELLMTLHNFCTQSRSFQLVNDDARKRLLSAIDKVVYSVTLIGHLLICGGSALCA